MTQQIKIKRVYEEPEASDGYRVLIDKLWPRGEKKEEVPYDFWDKAIAPSDELRKWFHEDQDGRWPDFRKKYLQELKSSDEAKQLKARIGSHKVITLLYASKNTAENNAVVLKEYLEG